MKIAIINNFPENTGVGRYAFELFNAMKRKTDIGLVYCCSGTEFPGIAAENVRGVKFPFLKETLNWYFVYPDKIRKLNGYDICHAANQFLSRIAKYRNDSVVTCHDLMGIREKDLPFATRSLQRMVFDEMRKASKIIANSEHTKRDIVSTLKIPEEKIRVIHYGIDHKVLRPRNKESCRERTNLPKDKRIILHVGSEEPRKNIENLVMAFKRLQSKLPDAVLVRVGEKRKSTEELLNRLKLEGKVIHIPNIPSKEVSYYYNSADLFVFPSFREGFGWPPLEAMACGCPTITSDQTSLPEVIGNGGIMVNPFDISALTQEMEHVLTDKKLKRGLIARGLKRAKTFSWEKAAVETLEVYEEV